MRRLRYIFSEGLDESTEMAYTEAILGDLKGLEESLTKDSPEALIIYFDYGLNSENIKNAISHALSSHIPIYYRKLGLLSPKYQNQWREYPGCPQCGALTQNLKEADPRYQCRPCGLESTHTKGRWTTLDTGDDIKDIHKGQRCAILGGGPSLREHYTQLSPDTILFGINHHASLVLGDFMDYIAFNDVKTWTVLNVGEMRGLKISRFPSMSDYHLPLLPRGQLSGMVACMVAQEMGFSEIILCGFDCSSSYLTPDYPKSANVGAESPDWHLKRWKTLGNKSGIFTMPSPLEAIFPLWNP